MTSNLLPTLVIVLLPVSFLLALFYLVTLAENLFYRYRYHRKASPMKQVADIKRFVYQSKRGDVFLWYYRDIYDLKRDFNRKAGSHDSSFTWWDATVCVHRLKSFMMKQSAVKRPECVKDAPRRKRPR